MIIYDFVQLFKWKFFQMQTNWLFAIFPEQARRFCLSYFAWYWPWQGETPTGTIDEWGSVLLTISWLRVCHHTYTYKWRAHVSRTISQIELLNKDYSLTDLTRRSWTRQSAVKPGRSRSAPGRRRDLSIRTWYRKKSYGFLEGVANQYCQARVQIPNGKLTKSLKE